MKFIHLQFLTKLSKWKTYKKYKTYKIARRYLLYYNNVKYPACMWRLKRGKIISEVIATTNLIKHR